jgi:hypothetical protein
MIRAALAARPFHHEHIVDGNEEWIVSTPLRAVVWVDLDYDRPSNEKCWTLDVVAHAQRTRAA